MKKKLNLSLMVIIFLLCFARIIAFGSSEDDFKFDKVTGTIVKYVGLESAVTIPTQINGVDVKIIGNNAFNYNASISTISMPNTVTNIKYRAFSNCPNLKQIKIPASVISLGKDVFYKCSNFEIIGEKDSYIYSYALNNFIPFSNAQKSNVVVDVKIPNNTILIGNTAISLKALHANYPYIQELLDQSGENIYYNLDGVTDGFLNLFSNEPITEDENNAIRQIKYIDFAEQEFTIQTLYNYKDIVWINEEYTGETITINKNQLLKISLTENGSTGYRWEYLTKPQTNVLEDIYNNYGTYNDVSFLEPLGIGSERNFVFLPVKENRSCDISLQYCQPWNIKGDEERFAIKILIN